MPSSDSSAVTAWLASQRDAMLALLEEVVNIDSGSYDKPGVDTVGERFRRFFAEHGIETTVMPNESFGDAIKAHVGALADRTSRSCSWDTATPCSRRGRRAGARSGSTTGAPMGRASAT
jgi:hypothetical protein